MSYPLHPSSLTARETIVQVAVIAAIVLTAGFTETDLIFFSADNLADYVNVAAPLFLIAACIERVVEVIMTVSRWPETERMELEIKQLRAQNTPDAGRERDLMTFRHETQKKSLLLSVSIGTIISLLGVRALELFVDQDAFVEMHEWQQRLFVICDVFVTGAVLGGGADGIHKVVSAFTTYLETAKKSIKDQKP